MKKLKFNSSKIISVLIVVLLFSIFTGMYLNYKLNSIYNSKKNKSTITKDEKDFIFNLEGNSSVDRVKIEEKYLKELEDLESKFNKNKDNFEIGKIYYYLGVNSKKSNDFEKSIKYFERCLEYLKGSENYYYLLKVNENLMNLNLKRTNRIEAIKYGNEVYSILNRTRIDGLSESDEMVLRMRVISGVLTSASEFGMKNLSEEYYNKLIQITESYPDIEDNINVYAKYQYNFNIKNLEEAKRYAKEYIKFFENSDDISYKSAHVYLLEVKAYYGDLEGIEELFSIVEDAYNEMDRPIFYATLDRIKGMYYKHLGDYKKSLDHLVKSVNQFEEMGDIDTCIELTKAIIELHDKVDFDLNYYTDKAKVYMNSYSYNEVIGKIANLLVEFSNKENESTADRIKEEAKVAEKIRDVSKKLNIVYIIIIILLILVMIVLKREVKERKLKEKELKTMVQIDYLTKAYSKKYIFEIIEEYVQNNTSFSLLGFDLDNFKKLNDTYGHPFGDEVLVQIVSEIKKVLKDDGFIGRFGGEEFIVLFKDEINEKDKAEEIRQAIENMKWNISDLVVTISGGLVKWQGNDINDLINEADELLYKAKKAGKNKIL